MAGVNKVIIVGRLGNDPEVKTITNNQIVARLSVATSESWNDKDGQRQERTEWHRVVVWGRQAETCGKYLAKGRQVYIEGRLQTRSWEDAQGQKKYSTEIVATTVQFLDSNRSESSASGFTSSQESTSGGFQFAGVSNSGGTIAGDHSYQQSTSSSVLNEPPFDPAEQLPF